MKQFFILIAIFIIPTLASSQSNSVINYGDSTQLLIGEKGVVDQSGNTIILGRHSKQGQDYPLISCFDANQVQKFSISLNTTGYVASKLIDAGNGEFIGTYSSGVNAIILKFNLAGDILWSKVFNNVADLESIAIDNTGAIYVAGGFVQNLYLIKLLANGSILWVKQYQLGSNYVFGRGLIVTPSNNVLLMASSTYMGGTSNRISLLHINPNGTMIWKKTYYSNVGFVGNDIARSPKTGHYLIAGYSGNLNNANTLNAFTLLVDSAGNYINNMVLGYIWWDAHYAVEALPEGGFVSSGLCKPQEICGGNGMFIKYTDMNDTVLTRVYGAQSGQGAIFQDIHYSNSGGIVAFGGGSTFGYWNNGSEMETLRFNNNLEVNCHRYNQTLTKSSLSILTDTTMLSESGVSLTYTNLGEVVLEHLKAADPCLQIPLSSSDAVTMTTCSVYPNPSRGAIQLHMSGEKIAGIVVYDIMGKVVHSQEGSRMDKDRIDMRSAMSGVYILRVESVSGKRGVHRVLITD